MPPSSSSSYSSSSPLPLLPNPKSSSLFQPISEPLSEMLSSSSLSLRFLPTALAGINGFSARNFLPYTCLVTYLEY
ncbi:hypothetical protein EON64_04955 [archaeon]|nr:MAG: hypothetical protein EON64_04955 [archaeon]